MKTLYTLYTLYTLKFETLYPNKRKFHASKNVHISILNVL